MSLEAFIGGVCIPMLVVVAAFMLALGAGMAIQLVQRWLNPWEFRRVPAGHCVACGYNLYGNVSGRCPECGTACGEAACLACTPELS